MNHILQLKKVINRVASELEDLGLTSEVLKELLEDSAKRRNSPPSTHDSLPSLSSTSKPIESTSPLRRYKSDATLRERGNSELVMSSEDGFEDSFFGRGRGSDSEKESGSESRIEEATEEEQLGGVGVVTIQQDVETDEGLIGNSRTGSKVKGKGKEIRKRRVRATYELAGSLNLPS